jgi:hypothetical protein
VIDVRCPLSHLAEEAARVFTGMFNAAMYFDLHQVPELFCGFPGDEGEAPFTRGLHPASVACRFGVPAFSGLSRSIDSTGSIPKFLLCSLCSHCS